MNDTKYKTHWLTANGRHLVLENMETEHLLNCYKHILNNFGFYVGLHIGQTGDYDQKRAEQSVHDMRSEFKQELLSRGVENNRIENWVEDRSKIRVLQ